MSIPPFPTPSASSHRQIPSMTSYHVMQLSLTIDYITRKIIDAVLPSWRAWYGHEVPYSQTCDFLDDFVHRIVSKACITRGTLMVALIYLRRVERRSCSEPLCVSQSPRLLFLAILIIASKSHQDQTFANSAWAMYGEASSGTCVSDFTLDQVNFAERHVLALLRWNTHVSSSDWTEQWNLSAREAGGLIHGRK
jgi:hypothetical protein